MAGSGFQGGATRVLCGGRRVGFLLALDEQLADAKDAAAEDSGG